MSNSTTDDEAKLKDTVIESLVSSGILSDFKGKLSLEIFKALETDLDISSGKCLGDHLPKTDTFRKLEPHLQTSEGALALYLIQDALERLGLHYTCTILKTEIGGDWNLFKNKSKKDLKQLLSPFNLEGILQDNEQRNGSSSTTTDHENLITKKSSKQPVLIELIAKVLRGEIVSNRNSFSNETFVKSPASENSTSTKTDSSTSCATFTETAQ